MPCPLRAAGDGTLSVDVIERTRQQNGQRPMPEQGNPIMINTHTYTHVHTYAHTKHTHGYVYACVQFIAHNIDSKHVNIYRQQHGAAKAHYSKELIYFNSCDLFLSCTCKYFLHGDAFIIQ